MFLFRIYLQMYKQCRKYSCILYVYIYVKLDLVTSIQYFFYLIFDNIFFMERLNIFWIAVT